MIKFQFIAIVLMLLIGTIHAQTAQNISSVERTISLNGEWLFKADYENNGENFTWYKKNFDDSGWLKMMVPGNWDIRNEYANYIGKGWYRKTFNTPSDIEGKIIRLNFEAVGIDYKVWLNGEQIASVIGGYFSTDINITGKLKKGDENTVVVCADNTFRSGAYWSWGGIRRPVKLLITNSTFIESMHVVANPDLKKGTASISVNTRLLCGKPHYETLTLDYELSLDGKTIRKGTSRINQGNDEVQSANLEFSLLKKEVKLWHFDFPNLYTLKLQIRNGKELVHMAQERFGIRKVEIAKGEFLLNGESVRGMGLNWVADDRLTGNTLPAEIYKRDIDQMKTLGVTIARLSHLPLPKEVYDYLDEKGMLVIAEIPVWGTTDLTNPENPIARSWIKQLVNTHFNHPSIIAWCVGNEIGELSRNPRVMEYGEKAIQYVKDSLDHSRLVVLVSHTANYQPVDPSRFGDFVPYNTYGSWGKNADKVHEYQPNKMVFISECGSNLIGEDLNTSTGVFPRMLNEFRGRPYLFGASIWTYNDYRSSHRSGDPTWDTKVSQNRDWGVVDGYGNPKRAFQIVRREFAPFKSFTVKDQGSSLEVSFHPRALLDLPAYSLRGYKVVCDEYDSSNALINKNELILPLVKPGDSSFIKTFVPKGIAASRKISVISPTNYCLMDTTLYYRVPEKPGIKAVFDTGDKIRVIFDHVNQATEYKVRFGNEVLNEETVSTIDKYIEIQKLISNKNPNKKFKIQLVAINGFGENKSEIQEVSLGRFSVFPPIIKAVKAFQNGIGIGYSSDKSEYLYKIQYSTSPDFSTNSHLLQTTNKGACYIPDLKPGMIYYVRMKAVQQYDLQSPWSETWSVKL